ncbi:MAG: glycosyltransferase [Candidatus Thermoplasmatota archaeon]
MTKKLAIFHDYFDKLGGGEKLVLTLAKALKADIISTDVDLKLIRKAGYENVKIVELGKNSTISGLKQTSATFRFLTCNFSNNYDFFILSGNWAKYAALHHHPNLYYCHAPVRVFYDLRDDYLKNQKGLKKIIFSVWTWAYSKFDKYSIKHIDKITVNSRNVQQRVKKYYNRESQIIYPPIPTSKYYFEKIGDYWLSVNRLYPHKRIELQLEIFKNNPDEKLKIVGGYSKGDESEKYVQNLKIPKNVELLGEVEEKELAELYASCKGHITTAQDEDFGMTAIEAMASGKVVLAVNEGGYKESVTDGKTGWLLPANADAFVTKIKELSTKELEKMKEQCIARAREFDEKIFIQKMKELIEGSSR